MRIAIFKTDEGAPCVLMMIGREVWLECAAFTSLTESEFMNASRFCLDAEADFDPPDSFETMCKRLVAAGAVDLQEWTPKP